MPPSQGVGRRGGHRVGEYRQHIRLGVPERVTVVAGTGESLARDRPGFAACPGLQDVEEGKPDRLLEFGIAIDRDVGGRPEIVEVPALAGEQLVPAVVERSGQGSVDLGPQSRRRPLAGPAIGQVFGERDLVTDLHLGGDRETGQVAAEDLAAHRVRCVEFVVHGGRHAQPGLPGVMPEYGTMPVGFGEVGHQGTIQRRRDPRVLTLLWRRLIGEQVRLQDQLHVVVEGFDLVADGRDRTLGERDESFGAHPHPSAGGRGPFGDPLQGSGAEVEGPLVFLRAAVPQIHRLVLDEQADDLPVGHVDHGLTVLGIAVTGFGIR